MLIYLYLKAYSPWSWVYVVAGVVVGTWVIARVLLWLGDRRRKAKVQ